MYQGSDPRPAALAWAIDNFELEKAKNMVAGGVNLFDDPSIDVASIFYDVSGNMQHSPAECFAIVEFLVEQGYGQALYDDANLCLPGDSEDPIKYYLEEAARSKSNVVPKTPPPWEAPAEYLTPDIPEDARPAALAWAINNGELDKAKEMVAEGVNLHDDPSISISRIFMQTSFNYKHSKEEASAVVEFLIEEGYGKDLYDNKEVMNYIGLCGCEDPIDYTRYCAANRKAWDSDLSDNKQPVPEKISIWDKMIPGD